MSYYNDTEKDYILESVKDFIIARKEQFPDSEQSELVFDVLEAVSRGLEIGLQKIEEEKK